MRIGVIGVGNMGLSLVRCLKFPNRKIIVSDTNLDRPNFLNVLTDVSVANNKTLIEASDVIFVAVKPKDLHSVCKDIGEHGRYNQIIISTVAAVQSDTIRRWIDKKVQVIRCMTNLSIGYKKGTVVWYGRDIPNRITNLLNGTTPMIINNEELIDHATVLLGCGPAFISKFYENFIEHGKLSGFNDVQINFMINSMFCNTATLLKDIRPSDLVESITTEGGITERGIKSLNDMSFDEIINTSFQNMTHHINDTRKSIS